MKRKMPAATRPDAQSSHTNTRSRSRRGEHEDGVAEATPSEVYAEESVMNQVGTAPDEATRDLLAAAEVKARWIQARAEIEADELRGEARAEREAAARMAVELVARAEAEAVELAAAERARLAVLAEDAVNRAVDLVSRAEAEAAEVISEAADHMEAAALTALDLVAKAENEAADLAEQAQSDLEAERNGILSAMAELAAAEDKLSLQREALESEKAALEQTRSEIEQKREHLRSADRSLVRKQDMLAEAGEAFVAERAHDQVEEILREAREQATALMGIEGNAPVHPTSPAGTAQGALARLDSALDTARDVVARRISAAAEKPASDNDTVAPGVWNEVVEDGGVSGSESDRPNSFEVPRDKTPAPGTDSH